MIASLVVRRKRIMAYAPIAENGEKGRCFILFDHARVTVCFRCAIVLSYTEIDSEYVTKMRYAHPA